MATVSPTNKLSGLARTLIQEKLISDSYRSLFSIFSIICFLLAVGLALF